MFNLPEVKRPKIFIYVTCVCGEEVEVDDVKFKDGKKTCPKCNNLPITYKTI